MKPPFWIGGRATSPRGDYSLASGAGAQSLLAWSEFTPAINGKPCKQNRIWGLLSGFTGNEKFEPRPVIELPRNVPNPFRQTTTINYLLDTSGAATLRIYDPNGRLVRDLATGYHEPGHHSVAWDGTDESGRPVPSGVYLCCLQIRGEQASRKLVVRR
jgi:hypothetical protein